MKPYALKPDRRSIALRGFHESTLYWAQVTMLRGGASPRAILAELGAVLGKLRAAGWDRLTRQQVVEHATLHER